MSAKKLDAKAFSQQKRKRRQWLTFVRMIRYGINNFSRNAWLTVAATAVMTVTLLIVFITLAARNILTDSITTLGQKVDMSIYLKNDTTKEDAAKIQADLKKLSSVTNVTYMTPDQARADYAEQNKSDPQVLSALNEAKNNFWGILHITVRDINDTSQLSKFVTHNEFLKKHIDPNKEPSFAGARRAAIESIGRGVSFAEKLGLVSSTVFIVISMLIIFNTIRMAIFNRKEEIQMMKLIGADRSFIRGPFVVEAVVYGFIAAIIATGIGLLILLLSRDKLESYGVTVGPTVDLLTIYGGVVLLGMILLGAIIGIVSSLLATRKYLKI
jgi:cell division transport system permease protein